MKRLIKKSILSFLLACFSLLSWGQQWDYSSVKIVDTGKYKALILQDPRDKRRVKGYLHLTCVISPTMLERSVEKLRLGISPGLYPNEFALRRLIEAINEYTDIKADMDKRIALSDPELLEVPWVFISSDVFHPTEVELTNLGRYLMKGGFLFLDAGGAIGSQKDINLRDILRKALFKVGKPCHFRRLPKGHRIFNCFFDFDRVPLRGGRFGGRSDLLYPEYLIGVDVDGRTAAILCYVNIGNQWHTGDLRSLQFGINAIIYALTQKGSITDRIINANRRF